MTSLAAVLVAASAAYSFAPGSSQNYTLKAEFNGFIPILGGNEGKVNVDLGIAVMGEAKDGDNPKASSEIDRFSIKFNDAPLPFGLDSVKDFFPRSTVTLTPQGKVLANTAPDRSLPVRLPGLDPKRLPDITFLPLELPADQLEVGKSWTFERTFNGAPIKYTCKVESIEGDLAKVGATLDQTYGYLENETLEVVKDEKDAVAKTETKLTGKGWIWFNLKDGQASGAVVDNSALTKVVAIKSKEATERKLDTHLEITRGSFTIPKAASVKTVARAQRKSQGFDLVQIGTGLWSAGVAMWNQASSWTTAMWTALMYTLGQIPLIGPMISEFMPVR